MTDHLALPQGVDWILGMDREWVRIATPLPLKLPTSPFCFLNVAAQSLDQRFIAQTIGPCGTDSGEDVRNVEAEMTGERQSHLAERA